jgi:hypothetical protein
MPLGHYELQTVCRNAKIALSQDRLVSVLLRDLLSDNKFLLLLYIVRKYTNVNKCPHIVVQSYVMNKIKNHSFYL